MCENQPWRSVKSAERKQRYGRLVANVVKNSALPAEARLHVVGLSAEIVLLDWGGKYIVKSSDDCANIVWALENRTLIYPIIILFPFISVIQGLIQDISLIFSALDYI